MKTYSVGTKAFIDAIHAMIPCVVTKILKPGCNGVRIGHDEIEVTVTKTMAGYRKGEILTRSAAYTPPKKQRFIRGFFYRINTLYQYN